MVLDALLSALVNIVILVGIPFLIFYFYHKRKKSEYTVSELWSRAGTTIVVDRYFSYCAIFAAGIVLILVVWPPSIELFTREGSPQRSFVGLGLAGPAIPMALLYGVVKTGFAEEFLFRGLIAGSLSRRLSLVWANVVHALIFLVPHIVVIFISPELWSLLIVIFAGALFVGWVRIKSGSIVGPWLVHAAINTTMCLSIAARTAL